MTKQVKAPRRTIDTGATSRTALLRAAEKLFAEKGFSATSIREIARESGLNLSLISYYFGSKEQLFAALMEERVHFLEHAREEKLAVTKDPWKRLQIVVESVVARLFHNRPMHQIIMQETMIPGRSSACEIIRTKLMSNQRQFAMVLDEGIKAGAFRKVDTAMVTLTVYGFTSKYMQFREQLATIRKEKGGTSKHFGPADRKELEHYLMDLLERQLDPSTKKKH